MPTLVAISYSPWSIRTRLALDAMGFDHAVRAYVAPLSEPRLRLELRRPTGRLTLPVMFLDDGTVLEDSLDIVLWAARQTGSPLASPARTKAIRHWNDVAETLLSAGRLRTTRRVAEQPAAMLASIPPAMRWLGPVGRGIGQLAARLLLSKYPADASLARMDDALTMLRHALVGGADRPVEAGDRLLDHTLSYADLTCAVAMSFVQPHAEHPLEDAARPCWTEPELAATHRDLLAWRDAIYAAVSGPSAE